MIIPSIDLMDGKAVQLKQGREKVLEREDVLALAEYYSRFGELAVVDLDAAMNNGKDNEKLIAKICKIAKCRVGGGIRTVEKAKRMIAHGAQKIIIGTAADENFLSKLPKDRVMVAIDSRNGKITIDGWKTDTDVSTKAHVQRFGDFCSGFLYTIVEKEGMLQGTNLKAYKEIREVTNKPIVAAGGISSLEEIKALESLNISSQLGMSIYTGKINLEDAFITCLDFTKSKTGLIPTVVQDVYTKQVLMLAYSNIDSVRKSLSTGNATYYSRSRKELWTKGLTSGNTQKLKSAKFDCDGDSLLYYVEQKGSACHLNRYSCFEDKEFALYDLFKVIKERKEKMPEGSYTTKLFKDEFYLKRKIMEEAFETVNFEKGDGLGWEAADLMYH
ncbi:MAG: phosphoribosyl-AMP cyclohydrolase, partial [Candidatus Gastranaerophilales bacterium]|nr:phosphoribosyl-AMP cyclohydrolase [Candidatus Gastranaerophilales bacterium]